MCLGEQHLLFLGSFGICGYTGQRWVLGLPPGLTFWGSPCVFAAQPHVQIHMQGAGGGQQWSSCVGVVTAPEDLGKSTNPLAF